MQALILCGGRGTRAWPHTEQLPKPMLPLGGRPILHHVMEIYARQGVRDFVLAAGYLQDVIAAYAEQLPADWKVDVVDTGDESGTGERVQRCLDRMDRQFFATYGDGVGDVDLAALHRRHLDHGGGATVTVVPLPSQYGTLVVDAADRVDLFTEKPTLTDHLINAGFFVFDRELLGSCPGDSLERDMLPALGRLGELFVYRHHGFWRSMDTHKDVVELDRLASQKEAPWLTTPDSPASESSSPAPRGSSDRT